ncbi:unnamed protein product [Prunus armeniaca]
MSEQARRRTRMRYLARWHVKSIREFQPKLGPHGDNPHDPPQDVCEIRRSPAYFGRANSQRQATWNPSQAQSTNMPHRQESQEDKPSRVNKEVNQQRQRHGRHRHEPQALRVEDVEKLVNNRLRNLKVGGDLEDVLHKEVEPVNSSPFINEIEQATPPRRFTTPSFKSFKGDSDP